MTSEWVAANVVVLKGRGFFNSVARGVVTAVSILMADHPQTVTQNLEDAIAFVVPLLPTLGEPSTPEDFRAGVYEALTLAGVEDKT